MNDRLRRLYAVRASSILDQPIVHAAAGSILSTYDERDHEAVRKDFLRIASLVAQVALVMGDGLDPNDLPMTRDQAMDAESSLGGDENGFHAEVLHFDLRGDGGRS